MRLVNLLLLGLALPVLADAPRALKMRDDTNVAYTGAFTPDGTLFVYCRPPSARTGKCEVAAMHTTTGRTRVLGKVAMRTAQPEARRAHGVWSMVVVAATARARSVFLRQAGGRPRDDRLLLWRRGKKAAELPFAAGAHVVPHATAQTAAIADANRRPEDVVIWDCRKGKATGQWAVAPGGRGVELAWCGGTLFALGQRYDRSARVNIWALHQLHPRSRKIGEVAGRKALRTSGGPGGILAPMLHGTTVERTERLILTQGRTLLRAMRDGKKLETVGQLAYDEADSDHGMLLTFDPVQGTIWTIEVAELDKKAVERRAAGYLPVGKMLGALGDKLLRVRAFALDAPDSVRRTFDVGLTAPMTGLYDRAMSQATESADRGGSRKGKVKLKERVELLGAHASSLLLRIELHVHYGTSGHRFERLAVLQAGGDEPRLFVEPGATRRPAALPSRSPARGLPPRVLSRDRSKVARINGNRLRLVRLDQPDR